MTVDRVQRRLAAILAADVVGYSRLMGKDEEGTLATLKLYRLIIDDLVAHHGGRVFGSAGDSAIAEFTSPVDAVRCATEIQLEIDKQNRGLPEPNRMRFRIGINLGDVVVDSDNLMGDGVNVAARLEALAPPGGICISETIHAQVRDRLSLEFLDLGEHTVKNIARPVRAYRVPLASEEQVKSPFRGLDVFDFGHSDMFFGRARAIAACLKRLEQLAAGGTAFLLLYGMSGSGKSSLLRAGLLPAIIRPGAVAGIRLWRRCVIRPSEGPDAIAALAVELLQENALPELGQDRAVAELADLLRGTPERVPALIRQALSKAATAAGVGTAQARLLLAVDQIEELFTTQPDAQSREAFVRLLATFAASGFVWVVGTIRADFFHRCSEIPGFSALKDGIGSYELLPPTGSEIAQIIREPARAAGLRFEETADQGQLEDVLQEAAAADPGSLPLLEFVLDALYEACRERRLLTFAAYRALGGLEGAIARRADEVVDALPSDVQNALHAVLRALTTVRRGDEAIIARPAPLTELAGTSARSVLVHALLGARLLVSDESAEGDAVIRVAHEALLSRWPRARDIVNANRSFLETRARLQDDARRWVSDNKNIELLLPAGKRLSEGEELLQSRRDDVDEHIIEYITSSLRAEAERQEKDRQSERALIEAAEATKRERLERAAERTSLAADAATRLARRTRYAAIVALALALIAGVGAVVGFQGQREASQQAEVAEANAKKALDARNEALRNQSLSLSFQAQHAAADGDTGAAILLALEALPKKLAAPDRPYLPEAELALYKALLEHRKTTIFQHARGVTDAAFSPGGDRIVTGSYDGTARVWDVKNGAQVALLTGHKGPVERVSFSFAGGLVATASRDGTARIWDAISGQQLFVLSESGNVNVAMFNPTDTLVLTSSDVGVPTIWDAKTGGKIAAAFYDPTWSYLETTTAAFSPDGLTFAAFQGSNLGIWNTEDGTLAKNLGTIDGADDIHFSPDGNRLFAAAWGARTWNAFSTLFDLGSGTQIAVLRGHLSDTHGGTFSHDGHVIATMSLDGTARVWDGRTGALLRSLGNESVGLKVGVLGENRDQEMNCAFSPDDKMLATVSMDNVIRVWDIESGSVQAVLGGHSGLVEHIAFSPDGTRLLTASHDGTARLWEIGGALTTLLPHKNAPTFAKFSGDGSRLITGGGDPVGHVWDTATGTEIATLKSEAIPFQAASFSPDGRRVVTASQDGSVLLWDVDRGQRIARIKQAGAAVLDIQFDPMGRVEVARADGTVTTWNTSGDASSEVLPTGGLLRRAIFSVNGQYIVTAANEDVARIWRPDGTPVAVLSGHTNRVTAMAFSPDGNLIATGSLDGTARLLSVKDGSLLVVLKGHGERVTDVAFSEDGQLAVTASHDRTARIWRVNDGAELSVLRGHEGGVTEAAFSPNGRYVVTASSQDRTVKLWDTKSGREIVELSSKESAPAATSASFSPNGEHIGIVAGGKNLRLVRAFQSAQDIIDYAHMIVPRALTPCERLRFFLPVAGATQCSD